MPNGTFQTADGSITADQANNGPRKGSRCRSKAAAKTSLPSPPLKDLKVVMLSQDPYPQPYVASGIAFSCDVTGKPEKSLKYIFKAIESTVYTDGYTWDPDLTRWSNQGILMLNTALTTQINKSGTHYDLWRPFLTFLFDYITIHNPGLVYGFLGKKAQDWADVIPDNN